MPEVSFILHETWKDSAPNVVLVHGALDRGMAFRKVVQGLHDYNTTVYDRRGYGASVDLGAEPDLDVHVADLLELMGEEPTVVIGHSFGGLISLLAASRHPERFAALGIFEAPIPGRGIASGDARPTEPDEAVAWFYKRQGDSAWDEVPERAKGALLAEGPALLADLNAAGAYDGPFDAAAIAVPTVVGWGDASGQHQIDRSVALVDEMPNAEAHPIAGAKHPAHRTHPAEFLAFIEATVARVEG